MVTCYPMSERSPREIAEDHYYAAIDLYADGKHEEAVGKYNESIEADETFTEALHGLARVYQDMELYDHAIAVAKRIAELDKNDILAHTSLSILYQKKGMVPEAEEEANKARILGWKQQLKKSVP
jgi:tetratricopeptide (TPR) repeat protein